MDNLFLLINSLHLELKKNLVYFFIVFSFWAIPFYLFKPDFFLTPIYIQFLIAFCLNLLWYFSNILFCGIMEIAVFGTNNSKPDPFAAEKTTALCVFNLSVSILYSYYYSDCFTRFLRQSFIIIAVEIGVFILVGLTRDFLNILRGK